MTRVWRVTILRPGFPLLEWTLSTERGAGSFVRSLHDYFPNADFVYVESV